MAVQILKERYSSQVGAVKLGATAEEGGTRGVSYMVGGEGALPFQHYEGEIPNRPIVAMEVCSMDPNWNENLKKLLTLISAILLHGQNITKNAALMPSI